MEPFLNLSQGNSFYSRPTQAQQRNNSHWHCSPIPGESPSSEHDQDAYQPGQRGYDTGVSCCRCAPAQHSGPDPGMMFLFMQMMMSGMNPSAAFLMMGFLSGSRPPLPIGPPVHPGGPPPPPPPRHSGYAERYEPNATVAVFDNFRDTANRTTHGEQVENIMMQQGLTDQDIQRFHSAEGGISPRPLREATNPGQFNDALNGYIEGSFTGLLSATSNNMETILDDPNSQIQVINQSQGISGADVTQRLMSLAGEDPQIKARLMQDLGLPPDASKKEFVEALANRVQSVSENSPAVQAEMQRYEDLSAEADSRGINHVLASGNNGQAAAMMRNLGIEMDPSFYGNALHNEHTTSVGALNERGSGPASFSAPEAEIAARGERVLTTADGQVDFVNGTSFAAPQVAAQMALMRRRNPALSDEEAEAVLTATADPVAGGPSQTGAGAMDPRQAQWLAHLSGHVY